MNHRIHALHLGPMDNLIYLIEDIDTAQAAVVDPAWDADAILNLAKSLNVSIKKILITHCHSDHINRIDDILHHTDAELHLLKAEYRFWQASCYQPTLHAGGDVLQLGKTQINILHTPGHTPGSACFQIGDDLLAGDTLFVFGCGHCRLMGGDPETLFHTLKNMKHLLPPSTIIHPGHWYAKQKTCTMAEQIEGNPFFHFENAHDFSQYRLFTHWQTRNTPYTPISKEALEETLKTHTPKPMFW